MPFGYVVDLSAQNTHCAGWRLAPFEMIGLSGDDAGVCVFVDEATQSDLSGCRVGRDGCTMVPFRDQEGNSGVS